MVFVGVGLTFAVVSFVGQVDSSVPSWVTNISDLGIVIFLVIVFFGGLREKPWWTPGSSHRAEIAACEARVAAAEKDRDYFRAGLFRALGASERAVETTRTLAEHTVPHAAEALPDDALLQELQNRGLRP